MQLFQHKKAQILLSAGAPCFLKPALIFAFAAAFFVLNADNCRTCVLPSIRRAFPTRGSFFHLLTAFRATQTSFRYCVITLELATQSSEVIEQRYGRHIDVVRADEFEDALSLERGVVLVSSHFDCFYLALIAQSSRFLDRPAKLTMSVIQPKLSEFGQSFFAKLQSLAITHRLEHIDLSSSRAGLEMLGAIRSNKVVACMIDNVADGGSVVFAQFLGQPTAFAAGAFAIAAKCNAPVLPVHIEIRGHRIRVVFGSAIITAPQDAVDARVAACASAVASYFSELITSRPGGWESWRTLEYRRAS